jgi:hypothetical protein
VDEVLLVKRLREIDRTLARGATAESRRKALSEWRQREPDVEFRCSIPDSVGQRVFGAVCLRYGLEIYAKRRNTSTICVQAPRGFVRQVLWPEFEAIVNVVSESVGDAVERVMERWSGLSLDVIKEPASPPASPEA